MATAASAEDGTGKAVGWVWERSAKWLRQNLPPAVPAPASADDRDGGGSKWLRTRVGGEPGELWQQAQDLIRTGCVHPGTAALAGNGDGPPIDEAAVHRQNLDAVIASCQLLRRALDPSPVQQPPQGQQQQRNQSNTWATPGAPLQVVHATQSQLPAAGAAAGARAAGAAPWGEPIVGQPMGHLGQPLWGGDDQELFQSAIAQQVLDAASDSTYTSDSSELDSASPWEPMLADPGQGHHGMSNPLANQQRANPQLVMAPLPACPPPSPYTQGVQCASCLKVFETDMISQRLKSVCAR